MPVIASPDEFNENDLFVDLSGILDQTLYLKIEGLNFAGSVKLKAATQMVNNAERDGLLTADSIIVESSSGNLGVALSMIAAARGYQFLCVIDPRCNPANRVLMESLGARVHQVTKPDPVDGFLGARLQYIRSLCQQDSRYRWLDQYTNRGNWQAHYQHTGPAIAKRFPDLDVLFVGAGTTGTLMGCARYFRDQAHPVRIVAVDSVGSVTFGGPALPRLLPGLGMSVHPPQLDASLVDEVVMVEEIDTVRMCHRLAASGFLFGGSTGTVVAGATRWLAQNDLTGLTTVALSPDLGGRYLDTLYSPDWLVDAYGADALHDPAGRTLSWSAA